MLISDNIARLIEKMLDDGGGFAELKRNDLASQLGCVPSQINYVITSRFTPERGYITESRRGGGRIYKDRPSKAFGERVSDALLPRDRKQRG